MGLKLCMCMCHPQAVNISTYVSHIYIQWSITPDISIIVKLNLCTVDLQIDSWCKSAITGLFFCVPYVS